MSFAKSAKAHQMSDRIFENREKVETREIIRDYPDGITVTDFAILKDSEENREYVVLAIAENPRVFIFGGSVVSDLFIGVTAEDFGRDVEAARADLAKEPMKIRLFEKKSQKGRTYTACEVL